MGLEITAGESVKPKLEKQLFAKEEEQNETTDPLLHKYASYWKLLRVTAFVKRFIDNCRKSEKERGPLTTKEFEAAAVAQWMLFGFGKLPGGASRFIGRLSRQV